MRWINPIGLALMVMLMLLHALITTVDRRPYASKDFYQQAKTEVAALNIDTASAKDSLKVGFAKVNITPKRTLPLAGYGGRKPKTFEGIHDSIWVRTIVFDDGADKVAFVSADLLIIHPSLANRVYESLPVSWTRDQIYFAATHTHSSVGGWAPGPVGDLFAGEYDVTAVEEIAEKIIESIEVAHNNSLSGAVSYNELQVPELIYNRLVKDRGTTDPLMKILGVKCGDLEGYLTVYSAHATCLSRHYREVSGDFPGEFNRMLESKNEIDFSLYAAGPVGSMGNVTGDFPENEQKEVDEMATGLVGNLDLLRLLDPPYEAKVDLASFELALPMRAPGLKVTGNLQLRHWLFERLFGDYELWIKGMLLGNTLFLGLPFDFSGELSSALYSVAEANNLKLVITSFNGGYGGYVVKDEWYDLPKYESRTMSWYGPDAGSYLSEIITLIIEKVADSK